MSGESDSIYRLVTEQANCDAGAPAILASGRRALTFGPLGRLVTEVAGALNAVGVGREDRVAVVLSNGPEMATSFLAVASSAVCAPLNPAYRTGEFEFYFSDLNPKVLIIEAGTESPAVEVARSAGVRVVELAPCPGHEAGVFVLRGCTSPKDVALQFGMADDVALVLHTSGTTSRPKMVPLTHANLCRSAFNIRETLRLQPSDRCLNVMPLFHIHGLVGALLSSMAAGASVVCAPGFYAPRFFEWLDEFGPTWYSAVPTMHQAILARGSQQREIIARRPLRFIRSSSSALPPQVMAGLEALFQAPVIESYGMTEAAHQMASNPLPPGIRKPGSVGIAAGPEIAILNEKGELAAGESGEIVIRGANVTRGYENNPSANASAFHDGWFRTGDLGRMDPEGYLSITGRVKEIINRGGEKISPREIDEVLMDHPAVAQAVAFALPDVKLGEDVGAAVVLRDDSTATESDLRQFAADRLADFKVPRRVVILEEIPKGPTGKIQRIGLAAALGLADGGAGSGEYEAPYVAPESADQELLCRIFSDVLGIGRIGIDDHFFRMGGDSVLAAQLLSRVREQTGSEVSVLHFFDAPTVRAMVQALRACKPSASRPTATHLTSVRPGVEYPLSFQQEQIFFLVMLDPTSPAYNRPAAYRLRGALNVEVVEQCLTEIVRRHTVLRSTFHNRSGRLVQTVSPAGPVAVPVLDLSGLAESERELRANAAVLNEARLSFDLSTDLMVRVRIVKLRQDEFLLLLTMHHIASDGWSSRVFLREFADLYGTFIAGDPSRLADPSLQFSDFAAGQRAQSGDDQTGADVEYWTHKLAGLPPLLPLPSDHPRPAAQGYRGARVSLTLRPEIGGALKQLCRREGATLFTALLAAFHALLHRYTGSEDIVVGTPVANRRMPETEPLIGLFVNMLVLRARVSGELTYLQLLEQTRTTVAEAQAHQDLSFPKLVEILRPTRSASYSPVFQVLFQLRNLPGGTPEIPGLNLEEVDFDPGIAQFDLSLDIAERQGTLLCRADFNTDLFEAETIRRMLDHFQTMLEAIVKEPDESVSSLPLLSEAERRMLLVEWNQTAAGVRCDRLVHELFEAQAQRTPEATALTFENRQWTYRELNTRANRLARHLQGIGVGPDVVVGLHVSRSPEMIAGLLAILKAGGAFVALDPSYPPARLSFALEDSGARVLLTESTLRGSLGAPQVVCLDTFWSGEMVEDSTALVSGASPENLVYIAYTSGSTGRPKGVQISHAGVANYLEFLTGKYRLGESDVILQLASLSFDASVREILGPLMVGSRLVLVPAADARDPSALLSTIRREGVTCLLAVVPSLLRELTDTAQLRRLNVPSLRLLLTTGERLLFADCRAVFQAFHDGVSIVNQYGPAECSMIAACFPVTPPVPAEGLVPIGRPVDNSRLYILDRYLNPVPAGMPGELYIGGAGVGRGYVNHPQLTQAHFVPDPFSSVSGQRLYRTGDLARYRSDGNIEFLGRVDDQVKIRGFRVEPGEVEGVLRRHPLVRDTAVIPMDDGPRGMGLLAYLVLSAEVPNLQTEFRAFLSNYLPDYMLPVRLIPIGAIPRLPNGKLDRAELPVPARPAPVREAPCREPGSPLEEVLCGIWAELLNVDGVGVDDNFFRLGGHSLLAARLMARLTDAFQVEIPLRSLFEEPTVAGLAENVLRHADSAERIARTAEVLIEISRMSDEEVDRFLAAKE